MFLPMEQSFQASTGSSTHIQQRLPVISDPRARTCSLNGPQHLYRRISTICCTQAGSAQFEQGSGSANFSPEEIDSCTEDSIDLRDGDSASIATDESGPANPVNRRFSAWRWEVRRLKSQLQGYGAAGLLSYGFLNSLYYSVAFLFFWNMAKVPRGLGRPELLKQFFTVIGVTWAASQISKIPRAAGALVLAPTVDGILIYLQTRLKLRTRRNATVAFVSLCLLLAGITFGSTLLFWL